MGLPKMMSGFIHVGGGFSIRFTTMRGILECRWFPHTPARQQFAAINMAEYAQARELFLADLFAAKEGGR
jgi:hypothetical protein